MKTQRFIDSKPPESYNQGCWLSLSQRLAWLLQRGLNKGNGDPYSYFYLLQAPLFISTEPELNTLFSGEYYNEEEFITRYIEDCYWVLWKAELIGEPCFFVLCIDDYSEHRMMEHTTQSLLFSKRQLVTHRKKVESYLTGLEQYGSKYISLNTYRLPNTVATSSAVYAQYCDNSDTAPRFIKFYANKLAYQIPKSEFSCDLSIINQTKEGIEMWTQEAYINAWNFSCNAHKEQFMPGRDIPYSNHIGLVAMEVMAAISQGQTNKMSWYQPITDPDLAVVCALLHDTIEDTAVTFEEIASTFDETTANGVLALTKNEALPSKKEQMQDSLKRIKRQPLEIAMVKLADRITNLLPPPHYWTKEKINNYREEAKLILEELGNANEYLAGRLDDKIKIYQQYC